MKNTKYLLTFILCFVCAVAFAQQKRITGHVTSKTEGAIMMANVCEKDKDGRIVAATQTDMSGNFALTIKNPSHTLQISYIGYQVWKVAPISQSSYRVELVDNRILKEAAAVALKRTKSNGLSIPEREMTSATQTFDMDSMEGLSFETAGDALQGQIAGLDIVANSGNPGAGTSMRLRGTTSVFGNQEPLIIVDGYPITEDLGDLDLNNPDNEEQFAQLLKVSPEDIKSITVHKDAASAGKWASQASNGVIEITTRRGARGKTKVGFTYTFDGRWQPKGLSMLNGDAYTMMLKEAYFNPRQSDISANIVELGYMQDHPAHYPNYNRNTDWVDAVTQFGQDHKIQMSISGGGEKATFRVAASYKHQKGTIIKQSFNELTTRLALDFMVSDRIKFTSNFALSYTNNHQNSDILGKAYTAMPNMAIMRQNYDPETGRQWDSDEYYLMPKAASSEGLVGAHDNRSSYYLSDMVSNGNPVAIANLRRNISSNYTITPRFDLEYKLLGSEDDEWHLDYLGSVNLNADVTSRENYYPSQLSFDGWASGVNTTSNSEYKGFTFTTDHSLTLKPHFENEKHSFQILGGFYASSSTSASQNITSSGINGGITDPTVPGYLQSLGTGTGRGRYAKFYAVSHYSFGGKYIVHANVEAKGSTKFGRNRRWGLFPSFSLRWNVSDEKFFKPLKKAISMFGLRVSWGINGGDVSSEGLMYNLYSQSGNYNGIAGMYPSNLRLTEIRWEKTTKLNVGFNLNLLEDLLQIDFNYYNNNTTDQIMPNIEIPSATGYSRISYSNVGELNNSGWELNINTKPVFRVGKFKATFHANIAQNVGPIIKEMDANVLKTLNTTFNPVNGNKQVLSRLQLNRPLGGIYGFRFKGVYVYDYDHCGFFGNEEKNNYALTAKKALDPEHPQRGVNVYNAAPVARDAKNNIIYDKAGNPLPMMYDYGGANYQFQGGDVVYEDVNHDGQINELDIQYLGSSNPKFNGGFGADLTYGNWSLKLNFNLRVGNKIINMARLGHECMRDNSNQSTAVNWRWRKNGQVTEIPRALSSKITGAPSYNALVSDRYVEDGSFLRLKNLQIRYSFDAKKIKKAGLSNLNISASFNNLFCVTKYTGLDPERSPGNGMHPSSDTQTTPVPKYFTVNLNFGF